MSKYWIAPGVRYNLLSSLIGDVLAMLVRRRKLFAGNQLMNIKRLATALILFATLVVIPGMAQAQVFNSGPSDPALFTTVINLPPDPNIGKFESIDDGTQLNVADGGSVGSQFEANSGSEVNISGGNVGSSFDANKGSEINISGGDVSSFFRAIGSEVNISGGNLSTFTANDGSNVTFSGGIVDGLFTANAGSQVSISGGVVGRTFEAMSGSVVDLFGGEFRLNGGAFTGPTITLAEDDVFTGILANGSRFIFSDVEFDLLSSGGDKLSGVRLNMAPFPVVDSVAELVIDSPVEGLGLPGMSAGLTLNLVDGGSLPSNFTVIDVTLNVQGGTLGSDVETAGSVVNISEGTVGSRFRAYSGSEVNISGGTVGDGLLDFGLALGAGPGSVVNISGGIVRGLQAESGSIVNITGGTVETGIQYAISSVGLAAESGSQVNISGGTVTGIGFIANEGSAVNITGTQFMLNGESLDALVQGKSVTITEPVETLTGILADGSPFSFGQDEFGIEPNFRPGATITVTLSSLIGDVNGDGVVNFFDIAPFIAALSAPDFQFEADIDGNGFVNFFDIAPFIRILSGQ